MILIQLHLILGEFACDFLSVFSSDTFPGPACNGFSVNRWGCLCREKWNGEGFAQPCKQGASLSLSTWPWETSTLHSYKSKKTLEWLWNCLSPLAHWMSWHVRRLGMKERHGSRLVSLELWWDCFLAVFLLMMYRAKSWHVGSWWSFHPSWDSWYLLCLPLGKGEHSRACSQHPKSHSRAFFLWMALGPSLDREFLRCYSYLCYYCSLQCHTIFRTPFRHSPQHHCMVITAGKYCMVISCATS